MEQAIEFAVWLSDNIFENTYQDRDNDGKTWTSLNESLENNTHSFDDDIRYTIEEIYELFLEDTE